MTSKLVKDKSHIVDQILLYTDLVARTKVKATEMSIRGTGKRCL